MPKIWFNVAHHLDNKFITIIFAGGVSPNIAKNYFVCIFSTFVKHYFQHFLILIEILVYEEDKSLLMQRIYQLKLKCISPNIWSLQIPHLLEPYHDLQPW